MIERVVPAGADDRACRRAQNRLKSHIQIIAVMPIVAIDASCTGTDRNMRPFRPVIAYKDAVIGIPRLIVIDKRDGALGDALAPIIGPVHERRGCAVVFLDGLDLVGGHKSRPYVTISGRGEGDDSPSQNARYDNEQDEEMRGEATFMLTC